MDVKHNFTLQIAMSSERDLLILIFNIPAKITPSAVPKVLKMRSVKDEFLVGR